MSDETYNGWKNYPTWAVNLWLSNDEGTYKDIQDVTRFALKMAEGENERVAVADAIREFVTRPVEDGGMAPDLGASFAADLLGYALDSVDWFEIADAWLEDA